MGKGGYIGGSTIIGPQTPEWFGFGSDDEAAVDTAGHVDSSPTADGADQPRRKTTRNQRRKRKKRRDAERAARDQRQRELRAKREPLPADDDHQISNLRIALKGAERDATEAANRHERHRHELIELLTKRGLPLDRYPETQKLEL